MLKNGTFQGPWQCRPVNLQNFIIITRQTYIHYLFIQCISLFSCSHVRPFFVYVVTFFNFWSIYFFAQLQCILSCDNSTATYVWRPKYLILWRDSNMGSSVLEADAMTTFPFRQESCSNFIGCLAPTFSASTFLLSFLSWPGLPDLSW
jgi:hypothetical protein